MEKKIHVVLSIRIFNWVVLKSVLKFQEMHSCSCIISISLCRCRHMLMCIWALKRTVK